MHTSTNSRARRFSKRSLGALAAVVAVVAIGAGCNPIGSVSDQDLNNHPFLVCTRNIESGGNYAAVNPSGKYRGAYQFSRSTWDATARHAGWTWLVGVDPAAAAPWDQDAMALHLYQWQGASPWLGRCAGK
jgi:resuscitation-promoting factor RpfA